VSNPAQDPEVISSEGLRSSTKTVTKLMAGPAPNGDLKVAKQLVVAEVEGRYIFEGDILLWAAPEGVSEGSGIVGAQFRWPKALIPYQIPPGLPNPERVLQAINHWQTHTKIRFVERTPDNAASYPDFVSFEDQDGCFSSVGRQGRKQVISLGPNCTAGNAIHEIGHTVGLWHEQSRADRATFVTVHVENVIAGLEHNFDQHTLDGTDLGAYDYGSIMHYPRNAFSKNGNDTLVPAGGKAIGQRTALSAGDIAAVAALYP
jgi:hypothetical protein